MSKFDSLKNGGWKSILKNGRVFFFNTGWLVFDRVFHMLLSLVISSLTARYLGPDQYGLLGYGLAYINIFTVVCKLGTEGIIVNEIIKKKHNPGPILGTTIGLRMLSGLLSVGVIALAVMVLKPGDTVVLAITAIQSISLLFVAFDSIDFWFQSRLWSKYSSIAKSISYILVCGWKGALLILRADVTSFAVATIIDALAIAVLLLIFYIRAKGERLRFSLSTAKYLMARSHPFIISSLLITIYTQMDRIMLGSMSTDAAVGIYTAAMNIGNMWVFIPNALINSARPIILKHKSEGREEAYQKRMTQLYSAVIWISAAAGAFFSLFGRFVIWILYGEAYAQSGLVLSITIWSRLFSLIGTTRGIWVVCEGREKYVKYFVGAGALINLILNFCLIPLWGAFGAAAATLVTEIVSSVVMLAWFKKTRPLLKILKNALLLRF